MVRPLVRGVVVGLSIAVAWIGAATTPAWADEPPPELPPATFGAPPPDHQPGSSEYVPPKEGEPARVAARVDDELPGFITLDRMGTGSQAGIQVGVDKIDDAAFTGGGYALRFNPYGQYMFPGRPAGVYGQWSIAHSFLDAADGTGVGNLELGGVYLPLGDARLILRGGVALPTASSDDLPAVVANAITAYERITDYVLFPGEYTSLRLSASTVQRMDTFFFRADGGFDFVISRPGAASGQPSVLFRANVAGGIRASGVDFTVELANIAAVNGDNIDSISERFIHTAAIGLRTQGEDQFYFGGVFPLDDNQRGDLWILSLGYMRAFN